MHQGDFSEWPYPIYDPDTTHANPTYNPNAATSATNLPYLRQQFMGCDGATPNVICSTDPRLANSLAQDWLKFVPPPNLAGLSSNFESPVGLASSLTAHTDRKSTRLNSSHVSISYAVFCLKKKSTTIPDLMTLRSGRL